MALGNPVNVVAICRQWSPKWVQMTFRVFAYFTVHLALRVHFEASLDVLGKHVVNTCVAAAVVVAFSGQLK